MKHYQYSKPFGHPEHWRFSADQDQTEAIQKFLDQHMLTQGQQTLVIEYVRYFVKAPAYANRPTTVELQQLAESARTLDDVRKLIEHAQRIGIVPL